jgi:hypothetical protein
LNFRECVDTRLHVAHFLKASFFPGQQWAFTGMTAGLLCFKQFDLYAFSTAYAYSRRRFLDIGEMKPLHGASRFQAMTACLSLASVVASMANRQAAMPAWLR